MSDDGSGTDRTDIASFVVAVIALVVALVALVGTATQVLQQYVASAAGYARCGERVMGPWARHTKLVYHPRELRVEMIFRTPDISLLPCVPGFPSFFDADADMGRWDLPPLQPPEENRGRGQNTVIADYTATWLTLLCTVREMEHQTRLPTDYQRLRVRVRAKIQTLDLMRKPYASTTLSTVVHLAAMMGLHWKVFDRANDRYVADGNGLLLTGSAVPPHGVVFAFTRHGTPNFAQTVRVIPAVGINMYPFGLVPTIFRHPDNGEAVYLSNLPRDLSTLRFGSLDEISGTLALLGCPKDCVAFLSSAEHIFPVLFELVGMLGRSIRPRGSPFRTLPNPLPSRWDTSTFSPPRLLTAFVNTITSGQGTYTELVPGLSELAGSISSLRVDERLKPETDPEVAEVLHTALGWCDEWLAEPRDAGTKREIVFVIRTHLAVVATQLRSEEMAKQQGPQSPTLADLGTVPMDEREPLLMEVYFSAIFKKMMEEELSPWKQVKLRGGGYSPPGGARAAALWLVLMLRMVCFLNLHTFHPGDVQLPKSDVMGTRLPVYIS